jgi:hypothetical protein
LPRSKAIAYTPRLTSSLKERPGTLTEGDMRRMATLEPGPTWAICGYLAFTVALLLAVIVSAGSIGQSGLIVGLLAVSLPAMVAWLYIESTGWMGPEPMCRIVRTGAVGVAGACSFAGFFLTVWAFSRLAAFVVLLQVPLWYLAVSSVAFLRDEPDSRT